MHVLHALLRFFPFWALPLAFVVGEVGIFFRRRKRKSQFVFWGIAGSLIVATILWFVFRGDMNSDRWMRRLLFKKV